MAEWSKAIDLSSIIFGCAGSNPADTINRISYSKYQLKKYGTWFDSRIGDTPISSIGRAHFLTNEIRKQQQQQHGPIAQLVRARCL